VTLYGILGDAHGNKEAFLAALDFLKGRSVQKILSLGDIVGFNADPNECVAILHEHGIESIAGNHDLISIRQLDVDRCSDKAAYALRRTRSMLTRASAEVLAALPRMKIFEERFVLVHGGVCDIQQYVRTHVHVRENVASLRIACPGARVCFFGHTHEQRVFEVDGGSLGEIPAEGLVRLRKECVYFINPGSLDAARKSTAPRAECAIFDSTEETVEFHRVPYDHETAEARSRAQGYRMRITTAWLYSLGRRLRNGVHRLIA
jgi:predicted phosphodiesterase